MSIARRCGIVLLIVAGWYLTIGSALAQAIWFAPNPRPGQPSDYMNLFTDSSPWQKVAAKVQVFAVNGDFAARASDEDLRRIFADIKRRGFALQIGILPLTAPDGTGENSCGYHVEGYGGAPMRKLAQRLKDLGANPEYIGLDEPLYHGHVFKEGRRGCNSSIAVIAQDVAGKFREAREVFPGVRFGDVEPLTFDQRDLWFKDGQWLHDISDWLDAFEGATR